MKETRAKLIHQRFSDPGEGRDPQPIFAISTVFIGNARVQLSVLYISYGFSP
jgi:hypothetical protein